MPLADLVIAEDLLSESEVRHARSIAASEDRSLVEVLCERYGLREDMLADLIAASVGTVVVEVESGTLDRESVQLLREQDARRYLMISIAHSAAQRSVRVAFADPLDEKAVRQATESTGLQVEPVVATVSGLKAALDQQYGHQSTQVIRSSRRPRDELPGESTAQMEKAVSRPNDPLRASDSAASPEQRFEALLLALIDRGVLTRADYISALQRLIDRRR